MSQPQQHYQQEGSFNSVNNDSIHSFQQQQHVLGGNNKNNANTSPISSPNNSILFHVNTVGNELARQQELQQEEFGKNNNQNVHQQFQFFHPPQMSIQYSNTNVPFQNTSPIHDNTNNIASKQSTLITSPTQSYFQSLPPEEFREMFLKKVFLGEDPHVKTTQATSNNAHVIPPQFSQQTIQHSKPNVHNNNTSPISSPHVILPNQQYNQQVHARMTNSSTTVEMRQLSPQQLENLTEQQLMQYIMAWMGSAKTTNQ